MSEALWFFTKVWLAVGAGIVFVIVPVLVFYFLSVVYEIAVEEDEHE
jgi:hypothetical protein